MENAKNVVKEASVVSKPKFLKDGRLQVTIGTNGNSTRVTISENKLDFLKKKQPEVYAEVKDLFDAYNNKANASKKPVKADKPKAKKEKKPKVDFSPKIDLFAKTLKDAGITFEAISDGSVERIKQGKTKLVAIRHSRKLSVASKYYEKGKSQYPTSDKEIVALANNIADGINKKSSA